MLKKLLIISTITIGLIGGSAFIAFSYSNPHVDVFTNLTEEDVNQMTSILLVEKIDANKVATSGTTNFKLTVPRSDFQKTIEKLRQNGFPKISYVNIDTLFPSNQLVSSPTQESAKLCYLQEQKIAYLLNAFNGVIEVRVSISDPSILSTSTKGTKSSPSVSIIIVHSSDVNLEKSLVKILSLVKTSISGLEYENINVILEPTEYRRNPIENDILS